MKYLLNYINVQCESTYILYTYIGIVETMILFKTV